MNQKIKDYITQYLLSQGEPKGKAITEKMIIEFLRWEAEEVWEGDKSRNRWWVNTFKVVKIDNMLIGFGNAKTTGDNRPEDVGWEFDPSTICEVEAKEVKTIVYEPIKS